MNYGFRVVCSPAGALAGRVKAIAFYSRDADDVEDQFCDFGLDDQQERALLINFWKLVKANCIHRKNGFAGWDIDHNDLPFIWKRSLIHGIAVKTLLGGVPVFSQGRYPAAFFVDLWRYWAASGWRPGQPADLKLTAIAECLKLSTVGRCRGDFDDWTPEEASDHLIAEARICFDIAQRFGVWSFHRKPTVVRAQEPIS